MDRYAVKEIGQEHNGKKYKFPIGVKAGNVETDSTKRFTSNDEIDGLKVTVDGSLSATSENPIKNKTVTKALNDMDTKVNGKADVLKTNRTVYVSAQAGNDTTGDGTGLNPWYSIQKAVDSVPVINGNQEYTINIEPGTYSGFIAKSISATIALEGDITIQDNSMYPVNIDDSNIKIDGKGNAINITGTGAGPLLYIHNGGRINAYKAPFKLSRNGAGTGIQIVSDGGFSQTSANISFDNMETAINVSTNSVFYADGIYGKDVAKGISVSAGGRVAYGISNMNNATVETASGGRVYSGEQE